MIGKLIEINSLDSFYKNRDRLLGTLWEISNMESWGDGNVLPIDYYTYGECTYLGEYGLQVGDGVLLPNDKSYFLAVKFETVENDEVK